MAPDGRPAGKPAGGGDGVCEGGPILDFFYNQALPSHYAASIQILRTGAALAAAGGRFRYRSGALRRPVAEVMAAYGIAPGPDVSILPFFPWMAPPGPLRRAILAWRGRAVLAAAAQAPRRPVWMSRGTSARAVLDLLDRAPGWMPGRAPPLFVHEMHALMPLRELERRRGGRIPEGGALGRAVGDAEVARLRALEARVVQRADALVFLTPAVEAAVRAEYGVTTPGLVLASGVEAAALAAGADTVGAAGAVWPAVDVIYAGKLQARKGAFDLADVLARLPGRRMAVAGGPEAGAATLERRARELGIADRLEIAGWVAPSRIGAFLARGRVGLCPARPEMDTVSDRFSSPMKLLQMMALGLPVVASDTASVRGVAEDGVHALLVAPGDLDALAAAVERLLGDPDLAARLGSAARERVRSFDWQVRAQRLAEFIGRIDPATRHAGLPAGDAGA